MVCVVVGWHRELRSADDRGSRHRRQISTFWEAAVRHEATPPAEALKRFVSVQSLPR